MKKIIQSKTVVEGEANSPIEENVHQNPHFHYTSLHVVDDLVTPVLEGVAAAAHHGLKGVPYGNLALIPIYSAAYATKLGKAATEGHSFGFTMWHALDETGFDASLYHAFGKAFGSGPGLFAAVMYTGVVWAGRYYVTNPEVLRPYNNLLHEAQLSRPQSYAEYFYRRELIEANRGIQFAIGMAKTNDFLFEMVSPSAWYHKFQSGQLRPVVDGFRRAADSATSRVYGCYRKFPIERFTVALTGFGGALVHQAKSTGLGGRLLVGQAVDAVLSMPGAAFNLTLDTTPTGLLFRRYSDFRYRPLFEYQLKGFSRDERLMMSLYRNAVSVLAANSVLGAVPTLQSLTTGEKLAFDAAFNFSTTDGALTDRTITTGLAFSTDMVADLIFRRMPYGHNFSPVLNDYFVKPLLGDFTLRGISNQSITSDAMFPGTIPSGHNSLDVIDASRSVSIDSTKNVTQSFVPSGASTQDQSFHIPPSWSGNPLLTFVLDSDERDSPARATVPATSECAAEVIETETPVAPVRKSGEVSESPLTPRPKFERTPQFKVGVDVSGFIAFAVAVIEDRVNKAIGEEPEEYVEKVCNDEYKITIKQTGKGIWERSKGKHFKVTVANLTLGVESTQYVTGHKKLGKTVQQLYERCFQQTLERDPGRYDSLSVLGVDACVKSAHRERIYRDLQGISKGGMDPGSREVSEKLRLFIYAKPICRLKKELLHELKEEVGSERFRKIMRHRGFPTDVNEAAARMDMATIKQIIDRYVKDKKELLQKWTRYDDTINRMQAVSSQLGSYERDSIFFHETENTQDSTELVTMMSKTENADQRFFVRNKLSDRICAALENGDWDLAKELLRPFLESFPDDPCFQELSQQIQRTKEYAIVSTFDPTAEQTSDERRAMLADFSAQAELVVAALEFSEEELASMLPHFSRMGVKQALSRSDLSEQMRQQLQDRYVQLIEAEIDVAFLARERLQKEDQVDSDQGAKRLQELLLMVDEAREMLRESPKDVAYLQGQKGRVLEEAGRLTEALAEYHASLHALPDETMLMRATACQEKLIQQDQRELDRSMRIASEESSDILGRRIAMREDTVRAHVAVMTQQDETVGVLSEQDLANRAWIESSMRAEVGALVSERVAQDSHDIRKTRQIFQWLQMGLDAFFEMLKRQINQSHFDSEEAQKDAIRLVAEIQEIGSSALMLGDSILDGVNLNRLRVLLQERLSSILTQEEIQKLNAIFEELINENQRSRIFNGIQILFGGARFLIELARVISKPIIRSIHPENSEEEEKATKKVNDWLDYFTIAVDFGQPLVSAIEIAYNGIRSAASMITSVRRVAPYLRRWATEVDFRSDEPVSTNSGVVFFDSLFASLGGPSYLLRHSGTVVNVLETVLDYAGIKLDCVTILAEVVGGVLPSLMSLYTVFNIYSAIKLSTLEMAQRKFHNISLLQKQAFRETDKAKQKLLFRRAGRELEKLKRWMYRNYLEGNPTFRALYLQAMWFSNFHLDRVQNLLVPPDGNCQFHAIAYYTDETHEVLRERAVNYMREHPDEFRPFVPVDLSDRGEDGWQHYLTRMSQLGEWGDELTIRALSKVLRRPILVHHAETGIDFSDKHMPAGNPIIIGFDGVNHYHIVLMEGESYVQALQRRHFCRDLRRSKAAVDHLGKQMVAVGKELGEWENLGRQLMEMETGANALLLTVAEMNARIKSMQTERPESVGQTTPFLQDRQRVLATRSEQLAERLRLLEQEDAELERQWMESQTPRVVRVTA